MIHALNVKIAMLKFIESIFHMILLNIKLILLLNIFQYKVIKHKQDEIGNTIHIRISN